MAWIPIFVASTMQKKEPEKKPLFSIPTPFVWYESLEKVEFHETKQPQFMYAGIETRFYIKAEPNRLHEFLKWCDGDHWDKDSQESIYRYECERAMRSKKESPHFSMYINRKSVEVYPKQNYVAVYEVGLHYICQHCFDILPSDVQSILMGNAYGYEDIDLGMLYPRPRASKTPEPLKVKANDIGRGFMLTHEQVEQYGNSFVIWIRYRRGEEAKKTPVGAK